MRALAVLPLALLASACSVPETLNPVPVPSSSSMMPPPPAPDSGRAVYTGPSVATLGSADARVTLRLDRFGMQITNAAGAVLLDTFDGDSKVSGDTAHAYGAIGATYHAVTYRPTLIQGWDSEVGADQPWHHASSVAAATVTSSAASIDLFDPADQGTTYHVEISVDGPEVLVDASIKDESAQALGDPDAGVGALNQMGESFVLPTDEHFFGLGEKLVTVDHRGQHYECWTEEGGIGQGEGTPPGPYNPSPNGPNMTHLPVPFYISTKGYGLYLETTYRTGYSLGSDDPGLFRVYAAEPHLRYRVLVHDDPKDTLAHYTSITGRAHLPAPWVFGPRRRVDRGSMVNGMPEAQALRAAGVPTTVLDDADHFLPIGSEVGQEAQISAYNANLHALGFKADAYYNPYVSVSSTATTDLVTYARQNGLFVQRDDGTELNETVVSAGPQTVATIDLTNPAAVTWYGTLLQRALDVGYDGWMLDFGEYIPENAVMFDGTTGWEAHNAFPVVYDTAVFDYLTSVRGDDFMFFARAGYAGIQAVAPVIWSGDPAASFDDAKGLPAQVRAGINAGLSGVPFWGSDISGYTCVNQPPVDKELYLRWAEFGALSSDMHDENACSGADPSAPPKWTLWSDAETTQVYGQYALLHTRLFPYTYAAGQEATQTGMPVMRHPILMNPTDPNALGVTVEYYYGPSLYVAPVVARGATTRTFWLPPGAWVDWWTLAPVEGGMMVTRDVPLDTIPLYLKSGGIVAMLDPSVVTLAPHTDPSVVGLADVTGTYDVRAAIDPAAAGGRSELVDGTVLDMSLAAGKVTLPASIPQAADPSALATCTSCGLVEQLPGGATHVRISVSGSNDTVVQAGALTLHHHAVGPLHVRWDVVVAP